jgi:hypothetical protein
MALKTELMAGGIPAAPASRIGFDLLANITATGAGQSTAAPLVSNFSNISAGTGGVIIAQTHAEHLILNNSGSTITIYPPIGSFMNNGSVNAGVTLTTTSRMLIKEAGQQFVTFTSA